MKQIYLLLTTLLLVHVQVFGQSVPSYVPTNGLVGWWPFDNGNANDVSGNGHNGVSYFTSSTSNRFNQVNTALMFNGIEGGNGSTIEINDAIINVGQNQYTISLWFSPNNITQVTRTMINSNPHTGIAIGFNDNNIPGYCGYGVGPANAFWASLYNHGPFNNYLPHAWYNVILIKSGINYYQYINGVLDNSIVVPAAANFNFPVSFRISGIDSYNQIFDGAMDDIGIWNRALTQQEITNLYNAQSCQVSVTTQPSNQTTGTNRNVQFLVVSSDTNSTYRWQTDMGLGFQNLTNAGQYSGVNTSTLNVSNTSPQNDNQLFRCIVSTTNCGSDTSDVVTLNVNTSSTSTGVPNKFTYQSVVRDISGQLVTNQPVGMRLSLQRGPHMTNLYTETHQLTTNSNGLLTCIIGSGQPTLGMMDTIDWSGGMVHVKTEIDMTGGSNYSLVSTRELLSVPYALYSLSSGSNTPGPVGPMGPQGPAGNDGAVGPQGPSGGPIPTGGTSGQALYYCNGVPTWGPCPNQPTMPTVTTNSVTLLPGNSASTGGNVTSDGGSPVTHRGVVYDTTSNPSLSSNYTVDGSGTGSFVSTLTNLAPTTTYYTRAYATNSVGTAYGSVVSFSITLSLPTVSIGQNHAGGIVFYIDQTGQHGLVCAPIDQGISPWGFTGVSVQGTSISVGTGALNTSIMVGYGISAATLCDTLVLNGYSDWFLPSKDELILMLVNLNIFGFGGFLNEYYWSSSQDISGAAWCVHFGNGNVSNGYNNFSNYRVRAVRAF